MPILIEYLSSELTEIVAISPEETLEEAVITMIEHDFSQLPVVENGKPYGNPASFVTSNSIAHAVKVCKTKLKDLRVIDAIEPARTVSVDEDLFTKMDDLMDAYAVLVLNADGTIARIVTNYDTTQYFRSRAEDMILVEDIETTLKDHIRIAYGGEETDPTGPLQTAINTLSSFVDEIYDDCKASFFRFCKSKSVEVRVDDFQEVFGESFAKAKSEKTFDDLTLSDYIQLARRKEAWNILSTNFQIPDEAFREMLEGVRKTRNKLMHFRPNVTEEERKHLRFCAEWFKNHPPHIQEEPADSGIASNEEPQSGTTDNKTLIDEFEHTEIDPSSENIIELAEDKSIDSKYLPLAKHLLKVPRSRDGLILGFNEIENIIGTELPATAREHRSWWANDSIGHVQSKQWLNVNWRVVSINLTTEKVTFARAKDRERVYKEFFSNLQSRLKEQGEFPLLQTNPSGRSWLDLAAFNEGKQRLVISFAQRQRVRLEVYIDSGDEKENKLIFDQMFFSKQFIENDLGHSLEWERLDHRRASRIAFYKRGAITDTAENLESIVNWVVENALPLFNAFNKKLEAIMQEISFRKN